MSSSLRTLLLPGMKTHLSTADDNVVQTQVGSKGPSVWAGLSYYDPETFFGLPYMHLILYGVIKNFLAFIFGKVRCKFAMF